MAAVTAAQVSSPQQATPFPSSQPRPELSTMVQRMEQAARQNRDRYRAYMITREYRIYGGEDQQPNSTVIADISFFPPHTQSFKIREARGSSRGETAVRRILENEQQAVETGQAPGAVSGDNYGFTLEGEQSVDGHDCFVLGLVPKRNEKNLVAGHAWVDSDTYLVRRIQGQLAKMPSWWIKSVDVTLDFGDVDGMWLQTSVRAQADVRVLGPRTLQVNAIAATTGSTVAELKRNRPKAAGRPFRRSDAVLGSFEP
jgi:hypothetical protein